MVGNDVENRGQSDVPELEIKSNEDGSESKPEGQPRDWRPVRSPGGWIGIAATLLALACSGGAWYYAIGHPIAIDSYIATVAGIAGLALAVVLAAFTHGFFTLSYRIENRGLIINWLWIRETVPLAAIEGLYGGHRLGKKVSVEGLTLPGYYVGRTKAEDIGRLSFYGTTNDSSSAIIVATAHRVYAITPQDLDGFRAHLIELLEALPEDEIERAPEPKTSMPALLRLSMLRDSVAISFIALSVLVLLGSFGYVSYRFPELPELMALHFNFAGEPDLIGPPMDAYRMPLIGLLILGFNFVAASYLHQRRRDTGRVLAAATLFIQIVMLMAVVRVVH